MLNRNKFSEISPSTCIFRSTDDEMLFKSTEDELLSARQGYLILNPLRIRIDSVDSIGTREAKITFVLTDHALAPVPISNYDIIVEYESVSNGGVFLRSDLVKIVAGDIDPKKVTVIVRVPPKEISKKIRLGVRAICEQTLQGPVIWSEYIDRTL